MNEQDNSQNVLIFSEMRNSFIFSFVVIILCACNSADAEYTALQLHNVLWIGTSIPEGCHYPENSCKNLGWNCYNMSLGASGICLNEGFLNNDRDGRDLSETKEEKAKRYEQYVKDGSMTISYYSKMLNFGYDSRVIPYIDGTKAACDIVVFDHGFNDRNGSNINNEDMKMLYDDFDNQNKSVDRLDGDFNRSNFIEAFCFLLKKNRRIGIGV